MAWTFIAIVTSLVILPRVIRIFMKDNAPIKGVYRQKDIWSYLKFWVFYVLYKLRQRQNKRKSEVSVGEQAGYGMRSRSNIIGKLLILNRD